MKVLGTLIVLAALFVFAARNPDFFKPVPPTPEEITEAREEKSRQIESAKKDDIYFAGEEIIRRRLKAPSTADFSSPVWDPSDTGSSRRPDRKWQAYGHVDAQNAFGAKLRSAWLVIFDEAGDSVIYVECGDQHSGIFPTAPKAPPAPTPAPKQGNWMYKGYRRALDQPAR